MQRVILVALTACLIWLPGAPALAEKHALFVAVNDYPLLGEDAVLNGPANDVDLMSRYLLATPELGFSRERMTILANGGIAADGEPTLAEIVAKMNALAEAVSAGDFVYIHFAGHGSRQRARDPQSEPDGLDEIFLPADTMPAENGTYPNALVDDDLGAALDAIRAKGAFVFIVFDSCHSSTATRASGAEPEGTQYRWLPEPFAPGDAPDAGEASAREATLAPSESPDIGGMAAFYAAQTIEKTPEMPLPRGAEQARTYGLFSYTMLDVLAKNPGITYRELAQGILHRYAAGNFTKPTPLFEGDLDRVVFGETDRASDLSWPIEVDSGKALIKAGALQGLERGAILAVLPDPLADEAQALGFLRVRTNAPLTAEATPARYAGLNPPVLAELPASAVVRVVEKPLTFQLRVELSALPGSAHDDATAYARSEIEKIAADEQLPANLALVSPGEQADLRLIVASTSELVAGESGDEPRLWFLPPGGELPADARNKPHSIGLAGGMTPEQLSQVRENFVAVFRATSLAQLSELSELDRGKVRFGLEQQAANAGTAKQIERSAVPVLARGDQLIFSIDNQSTRAVDVDMLLIGPNYSIKHMLGLRFQRGENIKGALGDIADAGTGLWRLVLVMREAGRNSVHSDLSFLNQIGTQTRAVAATGPRDFGQLLKDIGGGAATRGASSLSSRNTLKGSLDIYNLEAIGG
jgi:hypothetical protein